MNIVVLLGWFFLRIESVTASQCLSCAPMPSSVPCITTRNCQSGQECYAKYAMKHDGTVMYEFGCHNSQTCPGQMGTHALIGKRATGDIELCYKCCQGVMCNQGTICTATPSTSSTSTTMSTTTAPAIPANPCFPSPCVHGSCFISSANPVTLFCLCPSGFEGVHCETVITITASTSTYTLPTATVITTMLAPTNVITTSSQTTVITSTASTSTYTLPTATVITTIVAPTSVILTSSPTTGGDVCLACVDSPVTRACHYTRTCESHENCFADAFENQNGDTIFDMGCRDIQLCGTSGKRKVENRSNGNTLICSKCCTGNICNAALCGQTGLPSAGPVCFHCDQASTPSTCNTIALCGRDDVCYVEKFIDALSRDTLYKSGCLHKIQCDKHANTLSLIGRKRYENTVMSGNDLQIQCCDSYLCNHGNVSANLGSPLTSGTVVPTHYSHSTNTNLCSSSPCIHGNCFSGSAGYLCQCEHGWQGKNCEQRQGPCSSAPCAHGICFESSIDYVCQCENGWTGKNCDQGQGPCSRAPCAHGNCFESSIDYVCQCENGWTGKNCDQVYGHWGSWSAWSFCTSNCNQTRTRACDNPAPLHGGRDCPGLTTQTQECPISKCQANDCSELLSSFAVRLSGVYTITTPLTHSKIEVLCDMKTDGGGWTVFQKRFDGSENFYRNFSDYENGFGSVHTEHWLGLKYIYEITSRGSYQLRVDILRSNGSNGYDVHGNFSLQPGTNYTLNIGSRLRSNDVDSTYSFTETTGTAPVGNAFSTYDHDVDRDESNCAALFKGGWWYNGCYGYINLNGVYKPGQYDTSAMRYDSRISINASTIMFKRV